MLTFSDWLMFIPASFLLSLTFGPNNFTSVMVGMRHSPTMAIKACTGRIVVFAGMIALTAGGLGIILATSHTAFLIIKWCGVAYLGYLGIKVMFAKTDESFLKKDAGDAHQERLFDLIRREFFIAAGNPKAILIMTAILPQFVDPHGDYMQQFALIGTTFLMTEYLAAWMYGLAGHFVGTRNFGASLQRKINHVTGGMFLIFAAALALAEQND
jgi:threonine/homoserine/homoserine lactone efflux protein